MTDASEVLLRFFDEDWRQVKQLGGKLTLDFVGDVATGGLKRILGCAKLYLL